MATFNLSRSTSGYETGIGRGMGYRDSNQDILGFVHMLPARARQRILDIASTQLSDGTCFHQYQPLTKKGNADIGGGFNDDPLWLILSTAPTSARRATRRSSANRAATPTSRGRKDTSRTTSRLDRLHAQEPRPPRPAAHRPRRLERLPEPQLLLQGAERIVPGHRRHRGLEGRVGHDRRPVPLRSARALRALPVPRRPGATPPGSTALRRHAEDGRGAGLGRGLVHPGLRRREPARRLQELRGGQDLHREPGMVRPRRRRRRETAAR